MHLARRFPTAPSCDAPLILRQLLSYTSDVLVAGASFSAAPPATAGEPLAPPATPSLASNIPTNQAYLHVIDRLRTLRTWLFHPGGATAIAAYSLPTAAPRVPLAPSESTGQETATLPVGPESHDISPRDEREDIDEVRGANAVEREEEKGAGRGEQGSSISSQQQQRQQKQQQRQEQHEQQQYHHQQHQHQQRKQQGLLQHGQHQHQQQHQQQQYRAEALTDGEGSGEELVDARNLASGALTAAIIPGRLQGSAGPGVLIAAGVALSGISFLSETEGDEGPLWTVSRAAEELQGIGDGVGATVPRVLGMRGLVSHSGVRQALVVVWVERPSFQVLDVGRAGSARVVEEVALERRHR